MTVQAPVLAESAPFPQTVLVTGTQSVCDVHGGNVFVVELWDFVVVTGGRGAQAVVVVRFVVLLVMMVPGTDVVQSSQVDWS